MFDNGDIKIMAQSPFVGCRIPQEWKERLDKIAVSSGRSQSDVLKDAIAQYLGEEIAVDLKVEVRGMKANVVKLSEALERLAQRVEKLEKM